MLWNYRLINNSSGGYYTPLFLRGVKMGEYAIRKVDRVEVKIGTCNRMYYLRYENRNDVLKDKYSLDPAKELNLIFRLPYPDEDHIPIGEYGNFDRGVELINFNLLTDSDDTGIIQLTHPSGLLVNLDCHHGNRLPDAGGKSRVFWNGKASVNFKLIGVKNSVVGLLPEVECKWCQLTWSLAEWDTVLPCIPDAKIRQRLEKYAGSLIG